MTDGSDSPAAVAAAGRAHRLPPRFHDRWLGALLLVVLGAHLAIANLPASRFIFDEAYYVPAARCLIAGQVCNTEHPPLATALIALSIGALGDTGYAWRLPSILFGTLAVALLYLLTRTLADRGTARLAAFLLGFETLWFVHSSMAMLDIVAVSLGLLALLLFARGEWVWAGAVIGLSMLAKEVTVLLVGVVALAALLQAPRPFWRRGVAHAGEVGSWVAVSALVVFLGGLQVYDFAYDAFPTALHHVAHMFHHSGAIAAPPASDAVRPFQWFSGFAPAGYLLTFAEVAPGVKRYYIQYYGQPNLVVVLLVWLALPAAILRLTRKDPNAILHVCLFAVSLLFFVALAAWRITYPFYMLLMVPSICVLDAMLLATLPRAVVVTHGVGVVMWFLAWFPWNLLAAGAR